MPGITHADYRVLVESWVSASRRHLYRLPHAPELTCYGIGNHGHWSYQANDTAFAAVATLAADPGTDEGRVGMSRDELIGTALSMARFTLATHLANGGQSTDGQPWGHSWISVLGLERMMHGLDAVSEHLDDCDREMMRAMMVSEADWLLDGWPVVADIDARTGKNHPESNMWNGAFLHRAAMFYPDAPNVDAWREQGTLNLLNAVSIPSDAESEALYDSRPLKEWHRGANMCESMACHHHAYLNIGYMVVTLSNLAMFHFACRSRGVKAPEALYLHAADLWAAIKRCTFADGRLLRIGGDTRVRYCYCQDYAIPAWLFVRDHLGDSDVEALEEGWLAQVSTEMAHNPDGSALGERLRALEEQSPLYYTRLEGDKGGSLSMGAYWRRVFADFAESPVAEQRPSCDGQWEDEFHGMQFVRSRRRICSWVWEAAERPQGLILPADDSSLAEWRTNLAGRVLGLGRVNNCTYGTPGTVSFPGGFATCGRTTIRTSGHAAEGESDADVATVDIAFTALPDDRTTVVMQRARAIHRVFLREVKGLALNVPNDVHNGGFRRYCAPDRTFTTRMCPGVDERIAVRGNWLNVDDRLGVVQAYGLEQLGIFRPADRQIAIHGDKTAGLLYVDEIVTVCRRGTRSYDAGGTLFDLGCALFPAGSETTQEVASGIRAVETAREEVRALEVDGADCERYLVIANFGDVEARGAVPTGSPLTDVVTGETTPAVTGEATLAIAPHTVRVLRRAR